MSDPFTIILISILILIGYHFLTKNKKKLNKIRSEWETGNYIALNEAVKSLSTYWRNKKEHTTNYAGVDELTADDLALYDVFKKLNYTKSSVGSEYLFNKIRDIDPTLKEMTNSEELYILLTENTQLREQVLLILTNLGKRNHANSSSFIYDQGDQEIPHAYMYVLLGLMPIVSIPMMFISLKYGLFLFFASFLLNIIIYYRKKSALENSLFTITYVAAVINTGKRFAKVKNPEFITYAKRFNDNSKPLKKISIFGSLVSSGEGGELDMVFDYIRMLFMIDFIAYNKILKTIAKNREHYQVIWELIGELDAAVAVAFYRQSLDTYCTPTFIEDEELSFENLAHPLLNNPVVNSSTIGKSTLITGSNASGKSTYIKAIAINAILAQTIHTVLADQWSMKPSYIVTSMAIQDNLLDGDSYFIAEIKSLKRIIRLIEDGKPCISFIDEILKGTNTIERIAASAAIMEWLAVNKGMNVIASHDIELTEMARHVYTNYHFRESIEDGEVFFDYKVHEGPSETRNAIKLLEILGYPETVTTGANAFAEKFTVRREWEAIKGLRS